MDKLDKIVYKTQTYGHNPSVWTVQNWIFDLRRFRVQEASGSNPDTPTKNPVTTNVVAGFFFVWGFERQAPVRTLVQKLSGGHFLGQGKIHNSMDAPLVGADLDSFCLYKGFFEQPASAQ